MAPEVTVAILSLLGTFVGSIAGILTSNKLTNYRISELEKKVDKHNTIVERVALLEQDNRTQWKRLDELQDNLEHIKMEVLKEG